MRRLLVCVALFLLPMLIAAPMTRLTIEVTNQAGKPVDRASVIVRFIKGHSVFKLGKSIKTDWEMKTSQEGRVTIPPIPQGDILIQVIAKNYQTYGNTVSVDEAEKTVTIKLNPPQAQYSEDAKKP